MILSWIKAFRLRTLPLAFSSIIMGTAITHQYFNWVIFSFSILTTLFLQVLSNLANDYGDFKKGTDNDDRVGPDRAMQSGEISNHQMKIGIIIFVILSLISGLTLVFYATRNTNIIYPVGFVLLGLLSILAAINYTMGEGAYGYKGWGDIFVFLFFGIVGVVGTGFLFSQKLDILYFFPAVTIGCFSSAVLNLNNMRDIKNDKACGKRTLVVKLGLRKAKIYHQIIIISGMILSLLYFVLRGGSLINSIYILSYIPFIIHLLRVRKITESKGFDPELKKVAFSTFAFSLLFWFSIYIN